MNLLIVSHSFYPSQSPRSFRTTELVKELSRLGHQITLLIQEDGVDRTVFQEKYGVDICYYSLNLKPIKISTHPLLRLISRFVSRTTLQLFEYPQIEIYFKVRNALKKMPQQFDGLISIAVPHPIHWGVEAALRTNPTLTKCWIADCGDPYMLCRTDTFRKLFYFAWFEKRWCRRCDYITIPVESGREGYYPEFRSKIRVIPQGFDFSEVELEPYQPNVVPTFAFAGGFILRRRDPRPILDLLLSMNRPFKFIVYNDTNLLDSYQEKANEKLDLRGYVPRPDLLKELSKVDFLLNIENGTQVQVPSKLIDYALTGRPILSLDCNQIDRVKLEEFLEGNYAQQYRVNLQEYDIRTIAQKFISLMNSPGK